MVINYDEMAKDREFFAAQLSDDDIYRTVARKAIELDADIATKIEILFQAIPRIRIVFELLKYYNEIQFLGDTDYLEMLELIISKYKLQNHIIDFDPTLAG